MSLKDRLNTVPKQQIKETKKEEQPKYYKTEQEAQLDTLGAIDTLLANDDLNSIFVSGAKNIYLERRGKTTKSTSTFRDNVQLENLIKKIAQNEGVELDEQAPFFKFNYKTGVNVLATLPPLSNVASLFIKCYKDKHATIQTLQIEHSISKEIALILEAFCAIKKNILIIGSKNTLKTTLLSALAKKIPTNNRAIIIDSENEFKITSQNCANYDFSKIDNPKTMDLILSSIVNSNPDKLLINTENEDLINKTIEKINSQYKGLILTLCANNSDEAIKKLSQILMNNSNNLALHEAKAIILSNFDIIIEAQKDELGRRKISSIKEINLSKEDEFIQDIFTLDYLKQHKSQGITPLFYEDIKNNSLPIGDNIFNIEYKHTYHKGIDIDAQFAKKGTNIDILKKFKKDLPTPNDENIETEEQQEIKKEIDEEELMQKAQEKFDELKKNAQMQGDFEIKLEDIQESQNEQV